MASTNKLNSDTINHCFYLKPTTAAILLKPEFLFEEKAYNTKPVLPTLFMSTTSINVFGHVQMSVNLCSIQSSLFPLFSNQYPFVTISIF